MAMFQSTLLPLSSGTLEGWVGFLLPRNHNGEATHYVHPYLSLPKLRLLKQF